MKNYTHCEGLFQRKAGRVTALCTGPCACGALFVFVLALIILSNIFNSEYICLIKCF